MTSPALLTDAVLTSSELLVILVGVAIGTRGSITRIRNGFSYFNDFPSDTRPNSLFGVRITILVPELLPFLTRLLQRILKLLDLVGSLISAFLGSAEIGYLLSSLFKPTTISSIVRGTCTPILLAQVAMLL
jgi:hypothetical protein